MSHREFSLFDRLKASIDESSPPPVPTAPMSKPKFSTDSGGISGGSSGTASWRYKGVSHGANKWVAEIRVPKGNKGNEGNKIWLGMYPTPLEAAFAYDVAVTCLGGGESMLNFHHPIYKQIPRILPDLSTSVFNTECRKVVREFLKLAKEAGNSVPMTLVGKPKYNTDNNTDSGGSPGGLPGTSRGCPDLCPECGRTFLESQSMLFHLSDHWRNQKFSPPSESSRDSGGDSRSPGMDSRWWSMYKGIRYSKVDDWEVGVATHNTQELPPQVDDWAAWIWLPHGNEILLGLYTTTLEAAYTYDVAVTCLGSESMLNFYEHPIYKQFPRISPNLPLEDVVARLKSVVKEFGKLAMEAGGYYGGLEQKNKWMDYFINKSLVRKSAQDYKDMFSNSGIQGYVPELRYPQRASGLFPNSRFQGYVPELRYPQRASDVFPNSACQRYVRDLRYPQQARDLDTSIQKNKRRRFDGISWLDALPTIEPANARNKQPYQPVSPSRDMLSGSPDGALKFTMADLNIITGDFSENLTVGQGGSGSVYRGQLKDGTTVAVKRIKKDDKNVLEIEHVKDFQSKADILFKEKHVNLVRLLGFLEDENELILVTEYVINGNLRQHLDGVPYGVILDMSKRCRISLDVVAALRHLHNQAKDDLGIIHRDIKSSDILITNDFRAKVAGFGLSRRSPFGDVGASSSSTQVKGTLGYMAHEHSIAHHLKEQIDVYSLGELLVEIFTGKQLVELNLPSDECFTLRWVLKQCAEGRLMDIIDPNITPTTLNLKILEEIFKLAASCLVLEKSNRPIVGDVWLDLSFIVSRYFLSYFQDLKDESSSKREKYEVQEEQKWDPEAYIEPNLQNLCLEESEASKGQEPTKHLDKIDSSNPSFMPTKPHGSLFVEGLESNKVETSMQLDSQLEVDSKQPSRQASELLVAKQDQTSPMLIDIILDVFPLKSDETYFEMLQEEIAKLGYISRLLSQGDDFERNLTNIGKISFFLCFNEKDNVFEFYFKNYQGMASIVGVGLECAKVVLEDGWRVTVQEISKANWDDAWKNFDSSSSTMKVTILDPLEGGMDNMEDFQEALTSIPRGQCLLLDLAQYFILKMAISSFLPRASMMHANTDSGTSSSPSNQDIARSSSSSDQKPSVFLQAIKKNFISREAFNQLKTKNSDGPPKDPLGDDAMKIDTTVHLKLLPGGCLYDGSNLLDATISNDKELETLTSQLDNTIYLEMMFKFLNEDDRKEIQVIVGPISFQFREENKVNYKMTRRFGWYHKMLDVSFGPVNACDSEIGPNHSSLDIVKGKKIITIGSSDATTRGTSKSMNGGVKGSIPHILTLSTGGSSEWSTTKCVSDNVGYTIEKDFEETRGGFAISPERNLLSSTLKYTYCAPDYMHELDHGKLSCEDYRKFVHNFLPICIPQDVKFEGTWHPKDSEYNPQVLAEYSLITSRVVHMTSEEISEKVVKKSWIKRCGHPKLHKESNEPLKYTQEYARSFFLNHAMTHLNGEKFKVKEFWHQRPLNETEPETHLEDCSRYAPQWRTNPLIGLNSK